MVTEKGVSMKMRQIEGGDLRNEVGRYLEPHKAGRKFMDNLIAAMLLKTQQKEIE